MPFTGPNGKKVFVSVAVAKPAAKGRGPVCDWTSRELDSSRILAAMQAALPDALARAAGRTEAEEAEAAAALGVLTAGGGSGGQGAGKGAGEEGGGASAMGLTRR